MALIEIFVTIIGVIMGASILSQAYRIFKRKSAKDISIITFSFLLFGVSVWVYYGFYIGAFPIIVSNSIAFIAILLVIIGWIKYGRNPTYNKTKKNSN